MLIYDIKSQSSVKQLSLNKKKKISGKKKQQIPKKGKKKKKTEIKLRQEDKTRGGPRWTYSAEAFIAWVSKSKSEVSGKGFYDYV